MAETDSAYKGITAATVSLASSSQSYSVWSVHSSEAHYSSAQRPEKRGAYPLQRRARPHLYPPLCHFFFFCKISVKESSFPQPLSNYLWLSDSPPAAPKKRCHYNYRPLFFFFFSFAGLFSIKIKEVKLSPLPYLGIVNVFRRSTLHLQRQPGEIRRTSPLSVFQVGHLLLWPPLCPAVTWLCLIPLRSSESRSLILPTLCPTSLHNLPSPNFPYRSHWLSFVCVWKAHSRLLARGCRQSTERTAAASLHQSWSQGWFIIPGLGFVCQQLLIHLQGLGCAESIDGEANAFKCKITPHLIMMLLIAAGTANCHLSCRLPRVCSVRAQCLLPLHSFYPIEA